MANFVIQNRHNGKIIEGTWDEICDYDKRTWILTDPTPETPLAVIQMTRKGIFPLTFGVNIFSMKDLEGVYIHGGEN